MATIVGTSGNDIIHGTNFSDDIQSKGGRDLIHGDAGNDLIYGGDAADTIFGDTGDDTINGDFGDDLVYGGDGNDYANGGIGNDTLHGGKGDDRLIGGDGNDVLYGETGNDTLEDGYGNDLVYGGEGNDTVIAGLGDDHYDGGKGFDTLDFTFAASNLTIDMSKGTAIGQGNDTFSDFETLIASRYSDNIKGSNGAETILAGAGDDVVRSLGGADTLWGGAGHDTFVYFKKDVMVGGVHQGVDVIRDFRASDTVDLRDFFKSGIPAAGIDSLVHTSSTATSMTVSVKMGDSFVDVAQLFGVSNMTASQMVSSGMLLA